MAAATFVIVGASLAGAKAAETLRADGFDGQVILIGEESVRPYERPPMSKSYLRGESSFDEAAVHSETFYADNRIELRTFETVTSIDRAAGEVTVSTGERIHFDAVLLATGASPRRLTVPGADLGGVHYLRSVADAEALREAITGGSPVAVIGGGWIGCEVAASARQLGAEVALIEMGELPLQRVLGPEVGRFYRDVHAAHGVDLHLATGVEALVGDKVVEGVKLSDGKTIEAGAVVVGIGVEPRLELAEAAGLQIDNGVVTDQYLATSAPNIYAAGDVANAWHPVFEQRIRLEHWSSALNQGPVAAKNMLEQRVPYERIPYFFSDQYDVGMEYTGHAPSWDQVVFRGDPSSGAFIAFWLREGRVAAGMNVNVWDVADTIGALVAAKARVDPAQLADPGIDLAGLVPAARG